MWRAAEAATTVQYRVTRDEKNTIVSDPNHLDDEQYVVRLNGQVVTVSLETQELVKTLPPVENWEALASHNQWFKARQRLRGGGLRNRRASAAQSRCLFLS
jgi:hypothetical protein